MIRLTRAVLVRNHYSMHKRPIRPKRATHGVAQLTTSDTSAIRRRARGIMLNVENIMRASGETRWLKLMEKHYLERIKSLKGELALEKATVNTLKALALLVEVEDAVDLCWEVRMADYSDLPLREWIRAEASNGYFTDEDCLPILTLLGMVEEIKALREKQKEEDDDDA